ncbi:putative acetyltransferase [Streptomyces sp. Amel2xB2]|uniref:GNAT family N-acetyltransferase n=1 Tax=Streptomyces sp. Amel2xB2 TaxID=1305829 RepID=UPI000DB95DBD|nr:GNAT family N-acetyltransferase [Streptomyces sp. Amel2xB2]RAJ66939.1 putative acetyltransferase [Streptomyces sp. Amel2xB2]
MSDTSVRLRPVGEADRPLMERLWLLFRHDMSEFAGRLPEPDGTFRSDRLDNALRGGPDWAAYALTLGERPAGLAFVRNLTGATRILNSFFVVRGARRAGVGMRAVRLLVAEHPGRWEIAFQDSNPAAVRFWRRVAAELAGDAWSEERRPVPDRPEVPPDAWISFDVPPAER